jgi:hypothetical protein
MHASPPGPFGIEVKMAAHKKRPWGKDRIHGKGEPERQQCERPELEQQGAAFARGRTGSSRKTLGMLYGGFDSDSKFISAGMRRCTGAWQAKIYSRSELAVTRPQLINADWPAAFETNTCSPAPVMSDSTALEVNSPLCKRSQAARCLTTSSKVAKQQHLLVRCHSSR